MGKEEEAANERAIPKRALRKMTPMISSGTCFNAAST